MALANAACDDSTRQSVSFLSLNQATALTAVKLRGIRVANASLIQPALFPPVSADAVSAIMSGFPVALLWITS